MYVHWPVEFPLQPQAHEKIFLDYQCLFRVPQGSDKRAQVPDNEGLFPDTIKKT